MPDPNDEVEIERNGREYARAGFEATISSLDVVHIRQWCIAHNLRRPATGKEHYPSRAYQVCFATATVWCVVCCASVASCAVCRLAVVFSCVVLLLHYCL